MSNHQKVFRIENFWVRLFLEVKQSLISIRELGRFSIRER